MRAIVTGHSRGLGEAIAASLLGRGVRLLGISRTPSERPLARSITAMDQVQLDLSDTAALRRWLAGEPIARFMDGATSAILVNNAGVLEPIGPPHVQDVEAITRAVAVNVAAPLVLAAAFAVQTSRVTDRRILHVSSAAGHKAYAGWSIYCATKAALDHHARCVVQDRIADMRIASVAPGLVDTEMQATIRATSRERFPDLPRFEEFQRQGQLRRPSEVAGRLVDYLLSARFGDEPVLDLHAEPPRP
jgi:benzil reductase ((S)-benzoin forming)